MIDTSALRLMPIHMARMVYREKVQLIDQISLPPGEALKLKLKAAEKYISAVDAAIDYKEG